MIDVALLGCEEGEAHSCSGQSAGGLLSIFYLAAHVSDFAEADRPDSPKVLEE